MKRRKDRFLRSLTGERPEARVSVQFDGLPQDSRQKLDEALRAWATWHADRYLPGYVPPETVSGKLGYAPDTMRLLPGGGEEAAGGGAAGGGGWGGEAAGGGGGEGGGAAFVWEDLPAAPAKSGVETMWFNVSYEQVGDVPKYDRGSAGLSYSARKRRASEGLLAAEEGEGVGKPVAKKQRGGNRCFNCGSYGHTLRECWREHNKELVEENKRELAESKPAGYRSAPRRYYLPGATPGANGKPAEQVAGEFEGLAPGQLSEELRAALGIGLLAPPPWLHRMRELGLPPGYYGPVPAAAEMKEPAEQQAAERQAAAEAPGAAGEGDGLGDFVALSPEEGAEEDAQDEEEWECTVQFPGVNAPAPEGADPKAWGLPSRQQAQQAAAGTPAAGVPHGFGTPQAEGRGSERGSRERSSERGRERGRERSSERGRERSSERRSRRRSRERSHERGSRRGREHSRERHSEHGGGGGSRWQPLRGLHPPRHSEHAGSEGNLQAAGGAGGAHHQQGAASAPDLLSYPPQQQQPLPGMPPLPPGFGPHHQQQHEQPPLPPLPPAASVEVHRASQSDPGHLLAASQQQQPQQAWGWGQQYAPHPAYQQQQAAYGQQFAYPQQQGWSQQGYPQPQAPAPPAAGASPGGGAGNGWQHQARQQRSHDHHAQQQAHHHAQQQQQGQEMSEEQRRRWRAEQQRL